MIVLTPSQMQALGATRLEAFEKLLLDTLLDMKLIDGESVIVEREISELVKDAQKLGLEYEIDIANFIALKHAVVASNRTVENSQQEEMPPDNGEADTAQEAVNIIGIDWVDSILSQPECDGDEKMDLLESRWRRLASSNPQIRPSIDDLDRINELF